MSTLAAVARPFGSARRSDMERAAGETVRLSASGSLLLDAVRFGAALAVMLHHFTDSRMSTGWPHLGVLGHEAVCVFFVLSGFVIRLITVTRAGTWRAYAIDRVSRIYSVVGPALLVTVLCEMLAAAIHPSAYALMRDGFAWRDVPLQLAANLSFTAQCWGYGINPLSNAPFWSLSYECLYYALYALMHYRVRGRWLWCGLLLLLAGPSIALLFPVWLLGVLACDLYLHLRGRARSLSLSGLTFASFAALLAALRHQVSRLLRPISHEHRGLWLTAKLAGLPHAAALRDRTGVVPWLTETSLSFIFIGLLTALGIVFGLLLLDRAQPAPPPRVARLTRRVADSTFALYLLHVPLMLLAVVCLGHPVQGRLTALGLLAGIVISVVPIALGLDRLKDGLRQLLRKRFDPPAVERRELGRGSTSTEVQSRHTALGEWGQHPG